MATYNYELKLIDLDYKKDSIGQQIEVQKETTILCDIKSISRDEFYKAAQAGLKPSITFIVHNFEYNGQKKVKFEGQEYTVLRAYATGTEEIELYCEVKIGG